MKPVDTRLAHLSQVAAIMQRAPSPELAGGVERQIGKAAGLTQFGVNHVTLGPCTATSRRHWHETEDEFVFVLSGTVTLIDENGEHLLGPGAFAGFPAGAPNAHHLVNRSSATAELMVVGLRKVGEERIHYPDQADPGPFSILRDANGDRVS